MERLKFNLPIFHRRDDWPVLGDVPGGEVPGMITHNGHEPKTAEELEKMTRELNNGHHPASGLGRIKILFRDATTWKENNVDISGWKILVGTAVALGTAVGIYEGTKKILEIRDRKHK